VHIGLLFSDLAPDTQISSFAASPDSITSAPEFALEPAFCRNRQAGQSSIAFARQQAGRTYRSCTR